MFAQFLSLMLPAVVVFAFALAAVLAAWVLDDDADRTDWPREDWRADR